MAPHQKDDFVKSNFQFINDGPRLNNDKAKTRTLIRSNATRYYWREKQHSLTRTAVKIKWQNPEKPGQTTLSSEPLNSVARDLPDENSQTHPSHGESFTRLLQTTGRYPQLSFNLNPDDSTADIPQSDRLSYQYFGWRWPDKMRPLSPRSLLGAGQIDPFSSYPSALPRSVVGELMTYGEWRI